MGGWDCGVVFALSGVWSQATASFAGIHPAAPSLWTRLTESPVIITILLFIVFLFHLKITQT
jgi:hypothetical protein